MQTSNYITIELKTNAEGGTAADVLYSGKDRNYAEKKYHEALATAATSGRPCHAALIVQSDAVFIEGRAYVNGGEE